MKRERERGSEKEKATRRRKGQEAQKTRRKGQETQKTRDLGSKDKKRNGHSSQSTRLGGQDSKDKTQSTRDPKDKTQSTRDPEDKTQRTRDPKDKTQRTRLRGQDAKDAALRREEPKDRRSSEKERSETSKKKRRTDKRRRAPSSCLRSTIEMQYPSTYPTLSHPSIHTHTLTPPTQVLVYDTRGQQIISPLLNVAELRDLGVTFHTNIATAREPLPGAPLRMSVCQRAATGPALTIFVRFPSDVPAVYFIMPTEENVKRICHDCSQHLYCASPLCRPRCRPFLFLIKFSCRCQLTALQLVPWSSELRGQLYHCRAARASGGAGLQHGRGWHGQPGHACL